MPQVERLYLQVMLPVSLLVLAAILTFNVAVEKRIKAKVKCLFLLIHPQMLKSGKLCFLEGDYLHFFSCSMSGVKALSKAGFL